jgi:hypothetical protein
MYGAASSCAAAASHTPAALAPTRRASGGPAAAAAAALLCRGGSTGCSACGGTAKQRRRPSRPNAARLGRARSSSSSRAAGCSVEQAAAANADSLSGGDGGGGGRRRAARLGARWLRSRSLPNAGAVHRRTRARRRWLEGCRDDAVMVLMLLCFRSSHRLAEGLRRAHRRRKPQRGLQSRLGRREVQSNVSRTEIIATDAGGGRGLRASPKGPPGVDDNAFLGSVLRSCCCTTRALRRDVQVVLELHDCRARWVGARPGRFGTRSFRHQSLEKLPCQQDVAR